MRKRIWKYSAALTVSCVLLIGTVFTGPFMAEEVQPTQSSYENVWLSIGSIGEQVVSLQRMLNALGYETSLDGDYGQHTAAQVAAFQRDYGLYEDGIAGPGTIAALQVVTGLPLSDAGSETSSENNAPVPSQQTEGTAETPGAEPAVSGSLPDSLNVGSQGEGVRALQQRLADLGYSVYVDGNYGPNTAAAVSAFQTDHGLYADGYAGPVTMAALSGGSQTPSVAQDSTAADTQPESTTELNTHGYLTVGSQGVQVELLQKKLQELGYPVEVDGQYGQYTASVVAKFQSDRGLYADGEAGPITLTALTGMPKPYDEQQDAGTLRNATRNALDKVGWDLYGAYQWAVGIPYVKWAVGSSVEEGAMYAFRNGEGDCIGKAAAFCAMARELGYDCNVIWGKVPYRTGGYGDHAWTEIVVNGVTYVCDPQFEWNDGRNGYMINYGQSGTWQYVRDGLFPG